MSTSTDRVYGGVSADERRRRRREQVLEAGLEVFATTGWADATVVEVCRTAGLSQRYFYEVVDGREALFEAVTDQIAADLADLLRGQDLPPDLAPPERAREVLMDIARYFLADPRRARVALVESLATEAFRQRRRELVQSFSQLAARAMAPLRADRGKLSPADRRSLELSAAVLTGGVVELLVSASTDGRDVRVRELVDHLGKMFEAAARL